MDGDIPDLMTVPPALTTSPMWPVAVRVLCTYKVVQIWPGLFVCKQVTVCSGHIWTTLYILSTVEVDKFPATYMHRWFLKWRLIYWAQSIWRSLLFVGTLFSQEILLFHFFYSMQLCQQRMVKFPSVCFLFALARMQASRLLQFRLYAPYKAL
jgi:hypothetical protein